MIKDVKSYLNTVGNRLSKAFSMETFGQEDQLEFWELSAEHVSRKKIPAFSDIVQWMDLLYRAPVHFVYKKKEDKLILERRHVITKNILKKDESEKAPHEQTVQEKELIKDFEYQLQNLEKKMDMDEVFNEHGITSHSIGQCEHIPLFAKSGDLWGIYCAGPYTKSPDQIKAKLSIVGRMLSNWLISLEEEESNPQKEYDQKIEDAVAKLGSGKLNTEGIAQILLRYIVNGLKADTGCVCEFTEKGGHRLLISYGMDDDTASGFTKGNDALFIDKDGSLEVSSKGQVFLGTFEQELMPIYFKGEHNSGFYLIPKTEKTSQFQKTGILDDIGNALAHLLDYRYDNIIFSNYLTDTYYSMLRAVERSREKTRYHTPRMMAFTQRFGMFFGLEDDEMEILTQTAKLHDIGYVGAMSIEQGKSIGGELSHPLIGANMIEQLALSKDVIEGIKTHHEWVNGNGSPGGLENEDIPWTGKIISLFEYVVDFVESHGSDESKTDEEWLELLMTGLMERADVEFDMVLVPTAVQLIQALGWEECVKLGLEE
jgi:HD-GYP domain-containing protein (c-di-GMP phosphodiesterase class II)